MTRRGSVDVVICVVIAAVICVVGFAVFFGNDPNPSPQIQKIISSSQSNRVTVEEISRFEDFDAYRGVRKIFIIRDNKTGIEYIGVSGVGISETGSHQAGKSRVRDER